MTKTEKLDLYQKLSQIDLLLQERFVTQDVAYKDYLIIQAGKEIVDVMGDVLNIDK